MLPELRFVKQNIPSLIHTYTYLLLSLLCIKTYFSNYGKESKQLYTASGLRKVLNYFLCDIILRAGA